MSSRAGPSRRVQDRLMLFNMQMVPNPSGTKMWGRKEAGRAGTEKVERLNWKEKKQKQGTKQLESEILLLVVLALASFRHLTQFTISGALKVSQGLS